MRRFSFFERWHASGQLVDEVRRLVPAARGGKAPCLDSVGRPLRAQPRRSAGGRNISEPDAWGTSQIDRLRGEQTLWCAFALVNVPRPRRPSSPYPSIGRPRRRSRRHAHCLRRKQRLLPCQSNYAVSPQRLPRRNMSPSPPARRRHAPRSSSEWRSDSRPERNAHLSAPEKVGVVLSVAPKRSGRSHRDRRQRRCSEGCPCCTPWDRQAAANAKCCRQKREALHPKRATAHPCPR
jgi:hypothetical protein